MKIIYFANYRIPTEKAHGIQVIKMCEALALAGFDLGLVLPARINTSAFARVNPFDYYGVKKIFKIEKIKCLDPLFLLKLGPGFYSGLQRIFFIISLFFYLICKKAKGDYIFYTRDEYLLPTLQRFNKKVIWEAHNLPQNRAAYLGFWRKCYKIISISQGLKSELVKLGVAAEKILVAPDGVDLTSFEKVKENMSTLRERLKLPLDKQIIMYTGHLYEWKGAQILVETASSLPLSCLVVLVGGTQKEIDSLRVKTRRLSNVLIVGYRPPSEIPYWLKAADVLVLPNSSQEIISQRYTSPLKLFEYMASGKPIVASNLPALCEILSEHNAILVPPDDPRALAAGLGRALQNSGFARIISQQAASEAKKYTWLKRAEKILNFIE